MYSRYKFFIKYTFLQIVFSQSMACLSFSGSVLQSVELFHSSAVQYINLGFFLSWIILLVSYQRNLHLTQCHKDFLYDFF